MCALKDRAHSNEIYENSTDKLLRTTIKVLLEAKRIAGSVERILQIVSRCRPTTIFDYDWSDPEDSWLEFKKLVALFSLSKNCNEAVEVNEEVLLNIPFIKRAQLTPNKQRYLIELIVMLNKIILCNTLKDPKRFRGIFLFQSLLNHSCLPNVDCIPFENKLAIVVSRPIETGEQLFCNYVANEGYSSLCREEMLTKLPFQCQCELCVNDHPLPFTRKDPNFLEPRSGRMTASEILAQFKSNCNYLERHSVMMPSYEVQNLMFNNSHLLRMLTEVTVSSLLNPVKEEKKEISLAEIQKLQSWGVKIMGMIAGGSAPDLDEE